MEMPGLIQQLELATFKVQSCHNHSTHSHKQCQYWHSKKDRRRAGRQTTEMCNNARGEDGDSCDNDACEKCHSKVEQLYSAGRYKTKFCTHYPNDCENCEYGDFCSFAHHEDEIRIELIHHFARDSDFFMFHYKTLWCPYNYIQHDRSRCLYAHNWQDFRRKPTEYDYEPSSCPYWNPNNFITAYEEGCKYGFNCNRCHGWKELEYHPRNYKTRSCTQARRCNKGQICPYFHSPAEKRTLDERVKSRLFLYYPRNRSAKPIGVEPTYDDSWRHKKSSHASERTKDRRSKDEDEDQRDQSLESYSSRSSKNTLKEEEIIQMVTKLLE